LNITFSKVNLWSKNESRAAVFFFSLIFIFVTLFGIFPIGELILWSFTNRELNGEGNFIFLQNYFKIFSGRPFYNVLSQTLIYTLSSVFLKLLIGISLALFVSKLINHSIGKKMKWFLSIMLIPWAVPTVASMLIWSWILYDLGGILNSFLQAIGFTSNNIAWLGSHKIATVCLITVNVWRGIGFFFVSILASILSIPKQRYFVGWIEGATSFTIFKSITLPGILPTLLVITLISLVNTYTDFQIVHILTDGGPGDSTQIFSTMIYEYAFRGGATLGYAAAFAISFIPCLVFLIIMLVGILFKSKSANLNEKS